MRKSVHKKEFCNTTIRMGKVCKSLHKKIGLIYFGKFEVFRGKKEFNDTITRRRVNHQKCTEMHTKKKKAEMQGKVEKSRTKKRVSLHDMRTGVPGHF